MNNDEIIDRNLEQHGRFMLYVLEHPELLDLVPDGAELIFLPTDDPELCRINLHAAKEKKARGGQVAYLRISVMPEVREVMVPKVELIEQVP